MASPIEARMIVDALPTPLLVLGSDQVVLAANACGITTFTQGTADPVGKNFKDVAAEIWRVPLGEAVDYVTREGRARTVSAMIPAPEATADPCDAVVQPIRRADGMLAGVVITIENARDSDRRLSAQLHTANAELQTANEELEARLEELRRAYRMDEERNRFLAMLAHELRNPLAAITNALSLLRRRRVTDGDRTAEHALRIAERQSQSQARLLEDLLDASRLVLGKITLRLEPTDLVTIARQAVDAAQVAIQPRAQMLRVQVPDHGIAVMADPVRLEQIVSNLLGNAIKYTAPGGQITVAVSLEAETARLTLTDTGIGIEPELLGHVFDLFTQGDGGRARAAGGLGIGLTVVRHLVELHGGTIEARSAGRGRGSTFVVSLPRVDAVTAATREAAAPPRMQPRRILVVDDNRDARELLRTILELDSHHVQEAADGVHAVRLAVSWAPEVALVDIGLPEMDGYEVARRIRKRLGKAVRLVALTGYGDAEARRLAAVAGFDDYLVKPVDPDTLAELLRTA